MMIVMMMMMSSSAETSRRTRKMPAVFASERFRIDFDFDEIRSLNGTIVFAICKYFFLNINVAHCVLYMSKDVLKNDIKNNDVI